MRARVYDAKRTLPLIAAGIGLCMHAQGAVTLLRGDAMGNTSFTNAANWSDGKLPNDPTVDYLIASGRVLRTPNYGDYVFTGKSLTIGTATDAGHLACCTWDTSAVRPVEFQNDGVVLVRGSLDQYNGIGTKVVGKITVAAPAANDFYSGINQRTTLPGMQGAGLWFTGTVVGEPGTRWRFQRSAYNQANCAATNSTFRFTGDLSGCYSTFVFRPYTAESAPVDTNRVTFSVGVPSFPGKAELWAQAGIEPYDAATDLTLGSLTCRAGSSILCRYDAASGAGCTITVTDALSVTAPVRVTTSGKAVR